MRGRSAFVNAIALAAIVTIALPNVENSAQAAPVAAAASNFSHPVKGLPNPSSAARSSVSPDPICNPGQACYSYVFGSEFADTGGARARFSQASPRLAGQGANGGHSLQELAVESADGSQVIEIGWTVDRGLNGDLRPHLFIFHWVNGAPTCYNGCGFISTNGKLKPGMPVKTGTPASFSILHVTGKWLLKYNDHSIGYFADSIWHGSYKRAGLVQVFGEVAQPELPNCTQMGNGLRGANVHASYISDFSLINSAVKAALTVDQTDPNEYSYGQVGPTSLRLGGPGLCT